MLSCRSAALLNLEIGIVNLLRLITAHLWRVLFDKQPCGIQQPLRFLDPNVNQPFLGAHPGKPFFLYKLLRVDITR